MLTIPPSVKVFLAVGVTDMRKSIEALAILVCDVLEEDPTPAICLPPVTVGAKSTRSCSGNATASGCSAGAWSASTSPGRSVPNRRRDHGGVGA